jgi:hypothetical protein
MRWPFVKKVDKKLATGETSESTAEPSAMERLLSKDCNRDEFVLLYLKLLQETAPDLKFEMTGDMEIQVVNTAGKEATTYLNNLWVSYSQSPADRRAVLERFVSVAHKLTEAAPPLSREQVVAQVKDSEYLVNLSRIDAVTQHLCGDLWIVYAQDLPDRTMALKASELDDLGIDRTKLLDLAIENLCRIMPAAEQHGDGPWYLLTAGGDYTASLLLFDTLWEQLTDSVEGEIVGVVPARDTLLYTGSGSAEGLKAIKDHAVQIVATGNYVVSDTLIVRKDGRWEVFNAN